ncbi:MAG: helix-turn-helix transcriptional regulator [Pseudomonadota bacterium]
MSVRLAGLVLVSVLSFAGLVTMDILVEDDPLTVMTLARDLFGMGLLVTAIASSAFLTMELRDNRRERRALLVDLERARTEGAQWRQAATVHIEGLSKAIGDQFSDWRLSESEAEIAGLLLKGLSHKEIADIRESGEATVRQQARSIYRKSGLAGRAELSAFFLEDLLAPKPVALTSTGLGVVRIPANEAARRFA